MARMASALPYPERMATPSHAAALSICDAHVTVNGNPFLSTPVKIAPRYPENVECGLSSGAPDFKYNNTHAHTQKTQTHTDNHQPLGPLEVRRTGQKRGGGPWSEPVGAQACIPQTPNSCNGLYLAHTHAQHQPVSNSSRVISH